MTAIEARSGHLCCGAKAIAEFIGATRRQVYHLVETGRLPHFHAGRVICARKSKLLAWIAEQEAASESGKSDGAEACPSNGRLSALSLRVRQCPLTTGFRTA